MTSLYSISTANNARFLEPESVADLFVAPPFFKSLFELRHQLLVGPRGSGKTTLLKMLRIRALERWGAEDASWARAHLPFACIFIPADTSWTEKVKSQASLLPPDVERSYTRAAHTLLLLRAIVEGFVEKLRPLNPAVIQDGSDAFRPIAIDTHKEVELCRVLQASWNLANAQIPTLLGLRTAISGRLVQLRKTLEDDTDQNNWSKVAVLAREITLPVSETVSNALDAFEHATQNSRLRWALLFDELEITPDWYQEEVLARFRSTDSRVIFKVAITPCGHSSSQFGGIKQPHRVDDYEEVPLWYSDSREAQRFCEAFWYKLLQTRGIPPTSPASVLGRSISDDYEPSVGTKSGRYGKNGIWFRHLQSLAKKDPSFSAYLARRSVDLTQPNRIDRRKMDSVLRKVAPIAIFRDYFLADRDSARFMRDQGARRTRKVVALYSGAKSIFRITEGNPRWYLSLVGQLLSRWERQSKTISRQQQAKLVEASSATFLATVAAYPNPAVREKSVTRFASTTVTSLIEKLGQHGFWEIVGAEFSDDPHLTFRIDIDDARIQSLVTIAINAGALVLVNRPGEPLFVDTPHGRVVRLSYHLASRFRTPLRAGRSTQLSNVLGHNQRAGQSSTQHRINFDSEDPS